MYTSTWSINYTAVKTWTQQWSTFLRALVATNSQTPPFRVFTLTVPALNFLRYLSQNLTGDQAGYATDRNLLSDNITKHSFIC